MSIFNSEIKKFLTYISFLMIGLILVDISLGSILLFVLRLGFIPPAHKERYEKFKHSSERKIDTLILGASHGESIMPDLLDSELGSRTFNYSGYQQMAETNLQIIKNLAKNNDLPKRIIYSAPNFFLYSRSTNMPVMYEGSFDDIVKTIYKSSNYYSILYAGREAFDSFFSSVTKKIIGYKRKTNYKTRNDGFLIHGNKQVKKKKKPLKWTKSEFKDKYIPVFKMLLDELEKNNIKTYLVETPEYYPSFKTLKNREKYIQTVTNLLKGRKNIYFISFNHERNKDFLKNTVYFRNGGWGNGNSHVSKKGSLIMSSHLGKTIYKIEHAKDALVKKKFVQLPTDIPIGQ